MKQEDSRLDVAEALMLEGKLSEASDICQRLLAENINNIEALYLLGNIAATKCDWAIAAMLFRRGCQLQPDSPALLNNLGMALIETARQNPAEAEIAIAEAATVLQKAVELNPDYLNGWENLGLLRRDEGNLAEAKRCMLCGLSVNQSSVKLWIQLAGLHIATYNFDDAAFCYRRALKLNPEDPADLLNRLATVQVYLGETVKALSTFDQAIDKAAIYEQKQTYIQNRLFTLHYPFEITPEQIAAEHIKWGRNYFRPLYEKQFANLPEPERRLRIGYLSPDFRMNAVSFFIQPVIASHNLCMFEIYCYSSVDKPDIVTEQLKKHQVIWRDISVLSDMDAASLIEADRIDILIELTGHGAGNRLSLMGARPAPVQVTWIGYPDTTGVPAIDYRITDSIADPPGMTEHFHSEQLLRLDPCFLCYRPGQDFAEQTTVSPFLKNGFISFGTMSNFSKINLVMLEQWADILSCLPDSRLVLRYRGAEHARVRSELAALLLARGISEDRLLLLGHANSVVEQLQGYHQIDIALDSFPYHGTTTTCEALFMGVPVITLAGRSHLSRVGASLLHAVDLPEFICNSMTEYRMAALSLATDPARLMLLHQKLRGRLLESRLTDSVTTTAELEKLYRQIWRTWCDRQKGVV